MPTHVDSGPCLWVSFSKTDCAAPSADPPPHWTVSLLRTKTWLQLSVAVIPGWCVVMVIIITCYIIKDNSGAHFCTPDILLAGGNYRKAE